jgi:outer membrane protein OmpA-like peptidoglycan-associated protein
MSRTAKAFLAAACIAALGPLGAGAEPFRLVERSDFSRYVDGRYIGHVYRETRGALNPSSAAEAQGYEGEFYVLEETMRDARSAARLVDRSGSVRLAVAKGGALAPVGDSGFPSLRALPSFPEDLASRLGSLEIGSSWTAAGARALDFEDSGSFVVLPFLAEYHYLGVAEYRGRKAYSLSAKFATRWKPESSRYSTAAAAGGPQSRARPVAELVQGATGTHDLDILVDAETLSSLFIRDRFDETFALTASAAAGKSERRSGFCLYFFEGSAPLDRGGAAESMRAAVAGVEGGGDGAAKAGTAARAGEAGAGAAGTERPQAEPLPPGAGPGPLMAGEGSPLADGGELAAAGLELDASPAGMVLRVRDLRFVADSDAILSSEKWRLDAIAAALKTAVGRTFLVAGHSAAVGKASGELELSIKRAKKVTDELAARGIEASRLLYRGYGSSKPLAPNDTEEGRAKNRRVEITILD